MKITYSPSQLKELDIVATVCLLVLVHRSSPHIFDQNAKFPAPFYVGAGALSTASIPTLTPGVKRSGLHFFRCALVNLSVKYFFSSVGFTNVESSAYLLINCDIYPRS